jgi:hypothetical protein
VISLGIGGAVLFSAKATIIRAKATTIRAKAMGESYHMREGYRLGDGYSLGEGYYYPGDVYHLDEGVRVLHSVISVIGIRSCSSYVSGPVFSVQFAYLCFWTLWSTALSSYKRMYTDTKYSSLGE